MPPGSVGTPSAAVAGVRFFHARLKATAPDDLTRVDANKLCLRPIGAIASKSCPLC
jgi:hypothetical protein